MSSRSAPAGFLGQSVPVFLTGLTAATLVIIFSISFSALIFSGPLAPHAPVGVGLALLGALILGIVVPLTSSYPGAIGGLLSLPVIALGVVAGSLAGGVSPDRLLFTVVALVMAAGVVTGVGLYFFGAFDLGKIGQYVPYPVVGGFLAGLGIVLVQKSLVFVLPADVALGEVFSLPVADWVRLLLVVGVGVLIWVVQTLHRSTYNIPIILAVATGMFWLVADATQDSLQAGGWLLGPFPEAGFWQPWLPLQALQGADWSALLREAPKFPVIFVLVLIPALMDASSLELVVRRDIDPNREIKAAGLGNILCGLGGGFLGALSLSGTTVVARAGLPHRKVGLISAGLCSLVFFFGAGAISYLPKFPIAGLLFYIGIEFMREWLVASYRKVSRLDYATILTVFIVVILAGFMEGFLVGLILGFIFFVFTYSRLPVIRYATTGASQFSNVERPAADHEYLKGIGERTVILRLQGFLFFGTARRLLERVRERMASPIDYLVLDFRLVPGLDTSAVFTFHKLAQYAQAGNLVLVLADVSERVAQLLPSTALEGSGARHLQQFPDLDRALEWVETRQLAARDASGPAATTDGHPFQGLFSSAAAVESLLAYCQSCTFALGSYLIRQGKEPDDLFLIESGEVSVYLEAEEQNRVRVRKYLPGSVVGELAMLLGSRRTASVIADSHVAAYRLSRADMERMKNERPEVAVEFEDALLRMLAGRLQEANKLIRDQTE